MIRNFFRHVIESFKSLKRNGWMTLASVSAVTVTLILVGVFLSVILNVTKIANDIEKDVNISVFAHVGTKKAELQKMKKDLLKLPEVEKVKFSSKDEQYKKLVKDYGKSFKLFSEDSNPLYDVFIVSVKKPEQTKIVQKKAKKIDNVYTANYGGLKADKVLKISASVKKWGLIGSLLLLFIAIFLISNTIRITIISRKREIQIMRLVGARNGYIRWPFFLEGTWIGIIGSIIPILLMSFGYTRVYEIIHRGVMGSPYTPIEPNQLILLVNLVMLGIGILIGSIGSILSMRRFLKI